MQQLTGLIGFAMSPIGLFVVAAGAFAFIQARETFWVRWVALAGLIFAASLNRFVSEWHPFPPPFTGPIDTLVANGRSLTILLLALCIVLPVRYDRAPLALPAFAIGFLVASCVIALKIFSGGSAAFALMSLVTTGLVFFLFAIIVRRWFQTEADLDAALVSIAIAVAFFVAINVAQYVLNTAPLAVGSQRFNGTTGNPQHAAAFLGVGIPALIYVVLTRPLLWKIAAGVILLVAAYFLAWTGSRTGLLMTAAATLLLLRRSGVGAILVVLGVAASAIYVILTRADEDVLQIDRFTSLDNTRAAAWSGMWRAFSEHPFLGAPITGERLGFGENSWLAIAATTGFVGLIPLLVGGALVLTIAARLFLARPPTRKAKLQGDALGAILVCLMVGSILEAYLLAVISASTILLLLVGITGHRRLALNAVVAAHTPVAQRPKRGGHPLHRRPPWGRRKVGA
ncbi:MAG: O-antigen ligase family protein [Pseudomonadota bacterium]